MKKNNNKKRIELYAKTFDIPMEDAKKLVDANFTLEKAEEFQKLNEYDVSAICYKVICREEKYLREGNELYNPLTKSMAEEIYNIFNKGTEPNIRDSIDVLSFRKKTVRTDYDHVGFDATYTLAEILINDQPFLDVVKKYEKHRYSHYDYNIASDMYQELTGKSDYHDCKDYLIGIDAVILTCGACFIYCDDPLIVRTKETENEIWWYKYYNCRAMNVDRSHFPVFRFDKVQYQEALEQLKAIAEE